MIRVLTIGVLGFYLAACGTVGNKEFEAPASSENTALLNALRQTLPGLYGNYAQYWTSLEGSTPSPGIQHWRLRVLALRSPPAEAWFSLLQYPASDAARGHTLLLRFSSRAGHVVLQFAPWRESTDPGSLAEQQLTAAARFLPGCEIRLTTMPGLLAGQTSAATCRLAGTDGTMISLVKDFAISPASIDIGDRIIDPASGGNLSEDSIFRFTRMFQYHGWAGIKPAGAADWQLARPLEIWSDGGTAKLVDLAGEPMGYSIRLAQVPWRSDQDTILRLDLVEKSSGQIIAYSWADNSAASLGINLGWIQVGLVQILP